MNQLEEFNYREKNSNIRIFLNVFILYNKTLWEKFPFLSLSLSSPLQSLDLTFANFCKSIAFEKKKSPKIHNSSRHKVGTRAE